MAAYISKQESENKPLIEYPSDNYPDRCQIEYSKFREPKEFDLFLTRAGEYISDPVPRLIFGIKAKPEEFCKYDFLEPLIDPAFVVHKRVVDKFTEICPEDFQAFNVEIHNLDPNGEQFVNKDFYLINILYRIDAIDREKATLRLSPNNILRVTKKVFKEDGMQGHMLARNELGGHILFHPKLAAEFKKSKGVQFLSDVEAP
jgi:hypothetical protein